MKLSRLEHARITRFIAHVLLVYVRTYKQNYNVDYLYARTKGVDVYCYGDGVVAPVGCGEQLGRVDGSSMATPAVAGLACLALQCAQKQGYNGLCHVEKMKKVINVRMRDGQEMYALNPAPFLLRAFRPEGITEFEGL